MSIPKFSHAKCKQFFSFFQKDCEKKECNNFLLGKGLEYNQQSKAHILAAKQIKFWCGLAGVKGMAVCNTSAFGCANSESDIDVFIITDSKYLWGTRLLLTIFLHLLKKRRHGNHIASRFCLSFYMTEEGELSQIALPYDPYLAIWTASLVPIMSREQCWEAFINKQEWIHQYGLPLPKNMKDTHSPLSFFHKKILQCAEYISQRIYKPRTHREYHRLKKPFGIIISESMLKFHVHDIRQSIADAMISSE